MSNRKINYNRPAPSSDSVKKRQNFEDVLNQVTTVPTPFFKSIGFWGAIGSSVVALTLFTYQYLNSTKEKNAYEANPTLAVQPTQLPQDTKCITPISENSDHQFESFTIKPDEEKIIFVEDGAVISIPANAFETESNAVITINTRIFRDKSEAFVAGIPMDYGDQSAFESAGMIEIRGEQNGQKVELKEGKEIGITLGLHKSPDGFNFYSLDDSNGKWTTHESTIEKSISSGVDKEKSIQKLESEIETANVNKETIEKEVSMLKVPTKSDYNIAENQRQVFELKFNKHEFPELKSFQRLQFEAKCSSLKYEEILIKTWSNVELLQDSKGEYQAAFSNRGGDKRVVDVVPVVTGDQAEVAFEKYQSEIKKIKEEKALKKKELEKIEMKNQERQKLIDMLKAERETKDLDYLSNKSEKFKEEYRAKTSMLNHLYEASVVFRTNRWGVFNSDKPVSYPEAPLTPYAFASNNHSVNPREIHVFDLDKDVQYKFGTFDHPLSTTAMNNNETVIVVRDRDGNMGYARVSSKKEVQSGNIKLTPIDPSEANLDFFKTLLDEDEERVRA